MSPRPAPGWWIRAAGRAYGPFPSERLPGFVREGRLTPETSVARDEAGPWLPAGHNPSLDELFAPPGRPAARPAPRQATAPPAPLAATAPVSPPAAPRAPAPAAPRPAASAPRAFLVFAELLGGREATFAQTLAQAGASARARPGMWLLRASADAAHLRNTLSQALGEGESLMVVEAAVSDAAWFNLGGEADRALRTLWTT